MRSCPNVVVTHMILVACIIFTCDKSVDQLGVEKPPRLEAHAPADKLSETKRVEREAKEAHKAELQSKKQKNHDVSQYDTCC